MNAPRTALATRLGACVAASILLAAVLVPTAVLAANGGATKLAIASSSLVGNATAGVSFTLTVQAQDSSSVVTSGFTDAVTVSSTDTQSIVSPGSPYTYLAGDNGSRTFTVTLKTVGSRTITFSSSGLAPATATITVDPGTASTLAFTQQPSSSSSGGLFLTQPKVAIQDAYGNTVTSASATVTLSLVPGTGTLVATGCASGIPTVLGIATFATCAVTGTGIGYRLAAAGGGYTATQSTLFDIADNLAFETQPGGGAGTGSRAQGGVVFANQPKVTVRAGTSNFTSNKAVNDGTTTVTLGIRSGTGTAGAILICDQSANVLRVTGGSAQFTGCRIDKSGTGYQLVATSVPSYGASVWYSSAFDVVAGSATTLMFVTQPAGAAAGQVFTTQPVVAITDAGGNIVTSGVSANVSLTIGANPGVPAGVLSCTPGITVATATGGVNAGKAIFSGCKISNAGVGYTLLATPTSIVPGTTTLLSATSTAFTVGAPAAQITLTPSAPTITWGATVVLTTQFLVNGSGKVFMLQAARDGVSWATITTLTTDSFGRSSFPYRPANNLYYRAVFAGTSDLQAATSLTARTVVRQISFLRPTNSGAIKSIARNISITFTTTVRPARPDLPVAKVTFSFYRQVGGSWVLITKRDVYVNATGLARTTFKFTSSGQWYVRSAANPTTYNANSVPSPRERYNVY
jgi:hypothetical protein